ncbi:Stp1/IreP family PP2C-type Ser/Thr phosphatase [Gordonibacter massiliensis (ex Traore et al. 2017)]|uniref:Stp1/IreP family PP2C-type Ser/Thr phosphatase n=1 Tax=Gordonibacter massiliensis (ex Traore et al. 2017) TaxID=1841863 RepID=A0A842JBM8_9ACTN|nr:Stp1/IreP family PP2C-type Ser/Thr phosphatase [Gordonibacter massiliensis (ex Traore et al. 2017)]MBC2887901.1 Stp1/IreP family PP2C-type Ser/Thr phosphatase [Gordonibacter massiliensis (ex Traore et al. 2017)]
MAAERSYKSTPHTRKGATTTFGSRTDIGCLRDHNEDSLIVTPPLFAVADGMGGHAAGEVASEIAVNVLAEQAPAHPDPEALGRAVEEANRAIIHAAHEGRGREGMGTTVTAAMLEGERLIVAQVGDSRAYLLHQGKLQQLTRDHSLMADMIEAGQLTPEEARTHPNRSVITRALGSDPHTQPDLYEINVETGDRLLVCSDGLSSMVRDQDIESVLARVRDPQRCASQLVNEAIAAGGHDNVTVIVADVTGFAEVRRKKMARKTKFSIALVLVLFAAIVGATAWGTNEYLHNAAYLIDQDGKVAIYRGVPGNVFGLSYSELVESTDVAVSDLQPGFQERLKDGWRVDSVEAAEELVKEYQADIDAKAKQGEAQKSAQGSAAGDKTADGASTNGSTATGADANGSPDASPSASAGTQGGAA